MIAALAATLLPFASGAPSAVLPQEGDDGGKPQIDLFEPEGGTDVEPIAETTIGMRVELVEFMIPGSDLVPRPIADPGRADVIVRIENTFNHGANRRYNMEITPFVMGEIDLRDHLVRADGSSMDDVPPLLVTVDAVREDPETVAPPPDPEHTEPDALGGYRSLLIAAGVAWGIGLIALFFVGRKPKEEEVEVAKARPRTLAERLHPLVRGARDGTLEGPERAELERLVLAHWRARKGLEGASAADAISALRRDEDAGPLLRKLEEWLHRPGGASGGADDEIQRLLEPFGDAPAGGERR